MKRDSMSAGEILEQLKELSNADRLVVIEAASRLVRNNLGSSSVWEQEQRLRATADALRDLYEPGGELTEWTSLDSEEFLDDYVQR